MKEIGRKKSIVLLSGGLDSLVNLAKALLETKVIFNLIFDYGQKSSLREISAARKISKYYNILIKTIKLPRMEGSSALTCKGLKIPKFAKSDLDNSCKIRKASEKVWVANRNGVFINVAAHFAESHGVDLIITGFNKEEAQNYPDNSIQFVKAVNKSLSYSTKNKVKIKSFTQNLNKTEIVKLGKKLSIPWQYIWSCYEGGRRMCGRCESCQRLKRAVGVEKCRLSF